MRPQIDIAKQQKRVDQLLGECQAKMATELSAFLTVDVKLTVLQNRILSKEDFFFEEASGKQVIANIDVVG